MNSEDDVDADVARRLDAVFRDESALVRVTTNPLILFALGTAPYTGGISSLLSDRAQRRQELRLRTFLLDLASIVDSRWHELENKIDREFVASDDFAAILEDVLSEVGRTNDEHKLAFLHAYVLSSAKFDRPDANWRDLFRSYLQQLSGTHLVCLRYVFGAQSRIAESDRYGSVRTDSVPLSLASFSKAHKGIDVTLAKICFADLANLSLLVDWRTLGNSGSFQMEYCITENGLRFMAFIEDEL